MTDLESLKEQLENVHKKIIDQISEVVQHESICEPAEQSVSDGSKSREDSFFDEEKEASESRFFKLEDARKRIIANETDEAEMMLMRVKQMDPSDLGSRFMRIGISITVNRILKQTV